MKTIGIACASGTFKGVFTHGVLAAFENQKIKPLGIGCSSSATVSGCFFVANQVEKIGADYWKNVVTKRNNGISMSQITFETIEQYASLVKNAILINEESPLLSIATSYVTNEAAAEKTQTEIAKKFGRRLLLSAMKKNRGWVDENLSTVYFSNKDIKNHKNLTKENFEEVLYATSRMLHEWDIPAWIEDKPYVDASYTCLCMVEEVKKLGCELVIAIGTEPSGINLDLFTEDFIKEEKGEEQELRMILPDFDLKDIGVDFTKATIEGVEQAYEHGYKKGLEFINTIREEN